MWSGLLTCLTDALTGVRAGEETDHRAKTVVHTTTILTTLQRRAAAGVSSLSLHEARNGECGDRMLCGGVRGSAWCCPIWA
jgi:hypothetical protein